VVGGNSPDHLVPQAELYDPEADSWILTGTLSVPRTDQTANLLPDGRVVVVGGWDNNIAPIRQAEIYTSATGLWTLGGRTEVGLGPGHIGVTLENGKVLVTGGLTKPHSQNVAYLGPPRLP